jgi:hypothetical protein
MMLRRFTIAAFVFAFAALNCEACKLPLPSAPPRSAQRAAVSVAADAWIVAANTCLDVVNLNGDEKLRKLCVATLHPAHDLIALAAEAVDTQWTSESSCNLAQAMSLIVQTVDVLTPSLGPKAVAGVKPVVDDALLLANALSKGCTKDAVAPVAPVAVDAGPPPPATDGGHVL